MFVYLLLFKHGCYDEYKMLITSARQHTINEDHESVKETPAKKELNCSQQNIFEMQGT